MDIIMQDSENVVNEFFNFTLTDVRWNYVGEGACHLIISLPDKQLILRFHKYPKTSVPFETVERERYGFIFLFHYALICPLLGRVYSILPLMGNIPNEEVQVLNEITERPYSRRGKEVRLGFVEIYLNNALYPPPLLELENTNQPLTSKTFESMATTYLRQLLCLIQKDSILIEPTKSEYFQRKQQQRNKYCPVVVAVEIKPKQGWIPLSERKLPICNFCAYQYTKLINGSVLSKSRYCPLDFFSGDPVRMKTALKNLITTPQNNLKIYKNSQIIFEGKEKEEIELNSDLIKLLSTDVFYNDLDDSIEKFCDLIVQALNSDYSEDLYSDFIDVEPYSSTKQQSASYLTDFESQIKLLTEVLSNEVESCNWSYRTNRNGIVEKILRIQRLDNVGLEEVFNFYSKEIKSKCGNYSYIDKLLPETGYRAYQKLSLNIAECYALASVAKDCSIFVTLQRIPDSLVDTNYSEKCQVLEWGTNEKYLFNVTVVDVGPKPLDCIDKHVKRNRNTIENCCKHFNINIDAKAAENA